MTMHTMDSTGSNVPAFITKIWRLVEDNNYNHLIQWNQNGRSFIIHDQSKFAKELLPLYFKHSNMASFIRQLNMYGFRKVANIENSGLRSERDDIEFYHQFFVKGKESELEFIKRKMPTGRVGSALGPYKPEEMTDILQDMESLKGKQDSVDSLLTTMQRENEALWREVAILRQKHHKQQQIVEKLIQFLVSLVQNRGVLGIKRKAQLMIDDTEENRQNLRNKMMKREFNQEYSPPNPRSNGPIIHDITDDDLEEPIISADSPIFSQKLSEMSPNPQILAPEMSANINSSTDQLLTNSTKPIQSLNILDPLQQTIEELGLVADPSDPPIDVPTTSTSVDVENLLRSSLNTPPGSPSLMRSDNQNIKSDKTQNNVKDLVLSTSVNEQMVSPITSSYLSEHVDGIEAELDWLQDQLSSGINIDASTLLGLFSFDDNSQSQTNYPMSASNQIRNNSIMGNEIIQFNPNNTNALFDDLDFDTIAANNDSEDPLLDEQLLPNLDLISEGIVSYPPKPSLEIGNKLKTEKTLI